MRAIQHSDDVNSTTNSACHILTENIERNAILFLKYCYHFFVSIC